MDDQTEAAWDKICAIDLLNKSTHTRRDVYQLQEIFIRFCRKTGVDNAPSELIDWIATGLERIQQGKKEAFPSSSRVHFDWIEVFYLLEQIDGLENFTTTEEIETAVEDILQNFLQLESEQWDKIAEQVPNKVREFKSDQYEKNDTYLFSRYGTVSFEKRKGRLFPVPF